MIIIIITRRGETATDPENNNFLEFRLFLKAMYIWDMGEFSALAHYRLRSRMKGGGVLRISAVCYIYL